MVSTAAPHCGHFRLQFACSSCVHVGSPAVQQSKRMACVVKCESARGVRVNGCLSF